jgi:hypothetical protein
MTVNAAFPPIPSPAGPKESNGTVYTMNRMNASESEDPDPTSTLAACDHVRGPVTAMHVPARRPVCVLGGFSVHSAASQREACFAAEMQCQHAVVAAATVLAILASADASASNMLQATRCTRSTAVGATIMGVQVTGTSTSRGVSVSGLTSGGTYTAGSTASVSLTGSEGQGLLEVVGGGSFSSGTRGCSDTRTTTLTNVNLVLPASGAVTIRGVWSTGSGRAVNAVEFALTGPAADPCAGVTCPTPTNECKAQGTCSAGTCSAETNEADGTVCNDGNAATTNDVCTAGVCAGASPPPPARTCADTDADGTADDFDCSGNANTLDAAPAGVTCTANPCTATECCTVVPRPAVEAASSGSRVTTFGGIVGVLLVMMF